MKKFALLALFLAGVASPGFAGQISTSTSWGPYQSGIGGEFTFKAISGVDTSHYAAGITSGFLTGDTFQSFCIEASEHVYLNTTYNTVVNTSAMHGSVGPSGDPLSQGTGYLYSAFAQGNLAGYAFGGTTTQRKQSADALQKAIWWLEQESGGSLSAFYITLLTEAFGSTANARLGNAATYGVYALNLTNSATCASTGGRCQDALYYYVPDGGTTLMLLGGALVGLGALRRKFSI